MAAENFLLPLRKKHKFVNIPFEHLTSTPTYSTAFLKWYLIDLRVTSLNIFCLHKWRDMKDNFAPRLLPPIQLLAKQWYVCRLVFELLKSESFQVGYLNVNKSSTVCQSIYLLFEPFYDSKLLLLEPKAILSVLFYVWLAFALPCNISEEKERCEGNAYVCSRWQMNQHDAMNDAVMLVSIDITHTILVLVFHVLFIHKCDVYLFFQQSLVLYFCNEMTACSFSSWHGSSVSSFPFLPPSPSFSTALFRASGYSTVSSRPFCISLFSLHYL